MDQIDNPIRHEVLIIDIIHLYRNHLLEGDIAHYLWPTPPLQDKNQKTNDHLLPTNKPTDTELEYGIQEAKKKRTEKAEVCGGPWITRLICNNGRTIPIFITVSVACDNISKLPQKVGSVEWPYKLTIGSIKRYDLTNLYNFFYCI